MSSSPDLPRDGASEAGGAVAPAMCTGGEASTSAVPAERQRSQCPLQAAHKPADTILAHAQDVEVNCDTPPDEGGRPAPAPTQVAPEPPAPPLVADGESAFSRESVTEAVKPPCSSKPVDTLQLPLAVLVPSTVATPAAVAPTPAPPRAIAYKDPRTLNSQGPPVRHMKKAPKRSKAEIPLPLHPQPSARAQSPQTAGAAAIPSPHTASDLPAPGGTAGPKNVGRTCAPENNATIKKKNKTEKKQKKRARASQQAARNLRTETPVTDSVRAAPEAMAKPANHSEGPPPSAVEHTAAAPLPSAVEPPLNSDPAASLTQAERRRQKNALRRASQRAKDKSAQVAGGCDAEAHSPGSGGALAPRRRLATDSITALSNANLKADSTPVGELHVPRSHVATYTFPAAERHAQAPAADGWQRVKTRGHAGHCGTTACATPTWKQQLFARSGPRGSTCSYGSDVGSESPTKLSVASVATSRASSQASSSPRKPRPVSTRQAPGTMGLRNPGNMCYQNATMQCLISLEPLFHAVRGGEGLLTAWSHEEDKAGVMLAFNDVLVEMTSRGHEDGAGSLDALWDAVCALMLRCSRTLKA